jgi:hypothetical protein
MNKHEFVLAALAPARGAPHSPVQVQKLLFLLDENARDSVHGPHFNFEPYHYGPFDKEVYPAMQELANEWLVEIEPEPLHRWNTYRLTLEGQKAGDAILATLPAAGQTYITTVSEFVRSLPFAQLVAAIYKAYPHIKVNSVFQE